MTIKVTFLGTSGAVPSPKRNHPSVLISYGSTKILVDCGEGTQIQFKKAKISAAKVTKLLITHWHGDHVLGIPGLLQSLSFQGYNKTLEIYGPSGIKGHIDSVLRAFPSIMVSDLRRDLKIKVFEAKGKFVDEEDFYIEAFPVKHGITANAYSFVIKGKLRIDKKKLKKVRLPNGPLMKKLKQGKDITYNGKNYLAKDLTYSEKGKKVCIIMDSLYDGKLAKFANGADLLIMESTYGNELKEMARKHKHRTAKQCAEIAKKAKVKKLVLTHLSERYDRDQHGVLEDAKKAFKNSFLVKDLDEIGV